MQEKPGIIDIDLIVTEIPSHGVNRDLRGESGHRARAGGDKISSCLFRLVSDVPIHPANPDSPRATVVFNILTFLNSFPYLLFPKK